MAGIIPYMRSVASIREIVDTSCELFENNIAFRWKQKDEIKTKTYRETYSEIKALTAELVSRGYEGKTIAVMGANSYKWALTYLTVTSGVGIVMPVDRDYSKEMLETVMKDSGASLIFYHDNLKKVIDTCELDAEAISFSEMDALIESGMKRVIDGDKAYENHKINPYDFGILLYTSGTMGVAKGVMLSQYNIAANIQQDMNCIHAYENDIALSVLPLHHTFECVAGFLSFFLNGGSVAYAGSLKSLVSDMQTFKPTVMVVVPLLLTTFQKQIMKKYSKLPMGKSIYKAQRTAAKAASKAQRKKIFSQVHDTFGGNIRAFLCGAAPIPSEDFEAFEAYGFDVFAGYGLTETSPVCAMHRDEYRAADDVGMPIPGVRMRINDPDENGVGELLIRGHNVMLGYYKNPEATNEVIRDGWFYTGDLAKKKENGAYVITGRAKSMIVAANGKKVFPEELEAHIMRCDLVQDCLVMKHPAQDYIVASLIPTEEAKKSGVDIKQVLIDHIKQVNAAFPAYKQINSFAFREEPFEKTTTQKIKRMKEVNKTFGEEIKVR